MNILIAAVSSAIHPDGVSRHAANLVRCLLLDPSILQVDLAIGEWQLPCMQTLLADRPDRLHLLVTRSRLSAIARNLWYLRDLPRLACERQSDLVHLTYPAPIRRSRLPCPVVVTLHDLYPYDVPRNFGYPRVLLNCLILAQCLAHSDAIASVSSATCDRLHTHNPSLVGKTIHISNCVEPDPSVQLSPPHPLLERRPFVLAVAQHRHNKNLPLTLSVFRRTLDLNPAMILLMVGNQGPESRALEAQIATERMQDHVLFLHGVTDRELQWCYRNAKLLLATSTCEGFGLPIVEAALAGCPVVCSDIAPFRELAGPGTQLIPSSPDVVHRFTRAIQHILHSPRPHPLPQPHLGLASIAPQYSQLYRRLREHPQASFHAQATKAVTYEDRQRA